MYLTAHRAQTPDGLTGVNAHLFLHFADPVPTVGSDEPDVVYISQFAPGTCVAEREEVRPGGNTIKSSLDVAGPDDAPEAAVRRVLAMLRNQLTTSRAPVRATAEGLASASNATLDFDDDPSTESEVLRWPPADPAPAKS